MAASLMFHRGDIKASESVVHRNYTEMDLINGIRDDIGTMPFFTPDLAPATPLVYKTRIRSFNGGDNEFPAVDDAGQIISETGQLIWIHGSEKGLVIIDSDKTQGFAGYRETMATNSTSNLRVNLQTPFATVVITSLDGNDLESSKKILLTVTSTSILTGSEWNAERTSLTEWGTLPFRIQPVIGTIKISGLKMKMPLILTPLDASGHSASKSRTIKVKNGKAEISIGTEAATWYLLER